VKLLRNILIPVVPAYHGITWLRNYGYDNNILKSKAYNFPVICVGNLSVGGTGKTPMIEYLIRLLKDDYRIATLSRGYGRKTNGFIIADENAAAQSIGDEPYQFYKKFNNIIVSVGEDRQGAIENILELPQPPQILLLDDAFQHRKVSAGMNILLTSYNDLYVNDMVLPTGNLREPKSGARRANVIIVTKCPENITFEEQETIKTALNIDAHQQLFFSTISYADNVISSSSKIALEDLKHKTFTLITGIANPKPLVDYLKSREFEFNHKAFKDHHDFTKDDITTLKQEELIITTEKDYVRLDDKLESDRLFYLPITSKIFNAEAFDSIIKSFVHSY
jgi:tetraacyldisaccharide 4'-kinase